MQAIYDVRPLKSIELTSKRKWRTSNWPNDLKLWVAYARDTDTMPRWPATMYTYHTRVWWRNWIVPCIWLLTRRINTMFPCSPAQLQRFSKILFFLSFSRSVAFCALAWLMIQLRIRAFASSSRSVRCHCAMQHSPHSWYSALSIWLAKWFVMSEWQCNSHHSISDNNVFASSATCVDGHGRHCRFCRAPQCCCSWFAAFSCWRTGRTPRREISGHQTLPGNKL